MFRFEFLEDKHYFCLSDVNMCTAFIAKVVKSEVFVFFLKHSSYAWAHAVTYSQMRALRDNDMPTALIHIQPEAKNGTLVNTVINIWREKDIRIFIWICAAELFFCLFSWPGSSGVHLLISALRRRFLVQIAFLVKILTFCISYSVSEGKERNEIKSKQKGRRENHTL